MFARVLCACAVLALSGTASAQFLTIPDSTGDRIMTFSPFDGSLITADFILDANGVGYDFQTPKDAINVGNEIWVSDQVSDEIYRFDLAGAFLGEVTGGMDNIRGMAFANNTVYVSNAGTNNGAPGDAVIMFDTAGNNMGSFLAGDPFDIVEYNGELLVSDIAGESILRRGFDGTDLGVFHDSDGTTGIDFPQQLALRGSNVLAAGFSPPDGLYEYDPSGAQVAFFGAVDGLRGAYVLGNGNILVTNGDGVWSLDPTNDTAVQIIAGVNGQYINLIVPAPAGSALLALGGLVALRRRR